MLQMLPRDMQKIYGYNKYENCEDVPAFHHLKSLSKNLPLLCSLKKNGDRQYQNYNLCMFQFLKYHPHNADLFQTPPHPVWLYLINKQRSIPQALHQ